MQEKSIAEKLEILNNKTNGKYKALLYDCDGTLADNMMAHKLSYKEVVARYGVDLDVALIDELAGWPTKLVIQEIAKRYHVDLPESVAEEKSALFFEKYINNTQPIPFVTENLKANVGKKKIGVVSGGSRKTVTRSLEVIGVKPLIDVLICAGDTPKGKPFPDPFLEAAKELGVKPEECLVFEDGDPGVAAAEAAGMDWVRVDKL
ncbi:HAD family hydrolase [Olivibacter sitiensis]|uniref:HAD family hydrolase n=1 Tax=Olivibacter sitiensis TaxID=376470 RepID=UPI000421DD5A|nr:HAD-IA family hydrolase [Olivibacter sitiensis]